MPRSLLRGCFTHPLYGLAWIGGGELLVRATAWVQRGKFSWKLRDIIVAGLAAAAVAAVPVVMWRAHNDGFLAVEPASFRLAKLPGGALGLSLRSWLMHEGNLMPVWSTVLPVLLVLPAGWLILPPASGGCPPGDACRRAGPGPGRARVRLLAAQLVGHVRRGFARFARCWGDGDPRRDHSPSRPLGGGRIPRPGSRPRGGPTGTAGRDRREECAQ